MVSTAHSGPEGVTLAREHAFDLVALDHYMPGQNGLETLEQLMQLPQVPAIVYVTGSDETDIAVSALKAGAADYVVKSFTCSAAPSTRRWMRDAFLPRRNARSKICAKPMPSWRRC